MAEAAGVGQSGTVSRTGTEPTPDPARINQKRQTITVAGHTFRIRVSPAARHAKLDSLETYLAIAKSLLETSRSDPEQFKWFYRGRNGEKPLQIEIKTPKEIQKDSGKGAAAYYSGAKNTVVIAGERETEHEFNHGLSDYHAAGNNRFISDDRSHEINSRRMQALCMDMPEIGEYRHLQKKSLKGKANSDNRLYQFEQDFKNQGLKSAYYCYNSEESLAEIAYFSSPGKKAEWIKSFDDAVANKNSWEFKFAVEAALKEGSVALRNEIVTYVLTDYSEKNIIIDGTLQVMASSGIAPALVSQVLAKMHEVNPLLASIEAIRKLYSPAERKEIFRGLIQRPDLPVQILEALALDPANKDSQTELLQRLYAYPDLGKLTFDRANPAPVSLALISMLRQGDWNAAHELWNDERNISLRQVYRQLILIATQKAEPTPELAQLKEAITATSSSETPQLTARSQQHAMSLLELEPQDVATHLKADHQQLDLNHERRGQIRTTTKIPWRQDAKATTASMTIKSGSQALSVLIYANEHRRYPTQQLTFYDQAGFVPTEIYQQKDAQGLSEFILIQRNRDGKIERAALMQQQTTQLKSSQLPTSAKSVFALKQATQFSDTSLHTPISMAPDKDKDDDSLIWNSSTIIPLSTHESDDVSLKIRVSAETPGLNDETIKFSLKNKTDDVLFTAELVQKKDETKLVAASYHDQDGDGINTVTLQFSGKKGSHEITLQPKPAKATLYYEELLGKTETGSLALIKEGNKWKRLFKHFDVDKQGKLTALECKMSAKEFQEIHELMAEAQKLFDEALGNPGENLGKLIALRTKTEDKLFAKTDTKPEHRPGSVLNYHDLTTGLFVTPLGGARDQMKKLCASLDKDHDGAIQLSESGLSEGNQKLLLAKYNETITFLTTSKSSSAADVANLQKTFDAHYQELEAILATAKHA